MPAAYETLHDPDREEIFIGPQYLYKEKRTEALVGSAVKRQLRYYSILAWWDDLLNFVLCWSYCLLGGRRLLVADGLGGGCVCNLTK